MLPNFESEMSIRTIGSPASERSGFTVSDVEYREKRKHHHKEREKDKGKKHSHREKKEKGTPPVPGYTSLDHQAYQRQIDLLTEEKLMLGDALRQRVDAPQAFEGDRSLEQGISRKIQQLEKTILVLQERLTKAKKQ